MSSAQDLEQIIRTERSAALIVNTCSRSGERLFFRAIDELSRHHIPLAVSYAVRTPDHLRTVVRETIAHGHKLIVVGGGDGTITSIIGEFAYRDVVLGLLPLGTGNSFARTLGVPLSLRGAVDVIAEGSVAEFDLGKVDGRYFANVAEIGLTAIMARGTSQALKHYLGQLAYVLVGFKALISNHRFLCTLRFDNQQQTVHTHEIIIANGRYYGMTLLENEETPAKHKLVILLTESLNHWQLFNIGVMFVLRRRIPLTGTHRLIVEKVWVETDPSQGIDIDGESLARTPALFSVASHALKVLVP